MLIFLQTIDDPEERIRFESIYRLYKDALFFYILKILNNQTDAEDALQDTFFCLAKNIKVLKQLTEPQQRAYIYAAAEHKAIDMLRKRKNHLSLDAAEQLCGIQPTDLVFEGKSTLENAFAKLPQRYKEVLLMKYYIGWTTEEIAKQLNIQKNAAQKLIYRAKLRLAKILEEADD